MKREIILSAIFLLIISVLGCSSNSNPVSPSDMNPEDITLTQPLIAESGASGIQTEHPYRNVFGVWKVRLDVDNLSAEIIPSRNAMTIGDIFDSDLLQFLTVSPCSNCLRITKIAFDASYFLNIDVGLKHPFGNITTRPDLHGFDVRLIFITGSILQSFPEIKVTQPDSTEVDASVAYIAVVNADGYTSHYDSIVNDDRYFLGGADMPATLNPFLRYFEDYSTDPFDPHAPAGHNVMPVGSLFEIRTAKMAELIGGSIEFYLVADVAYGHSAIFTNRTDPQYYLPSFNRTEPWRIEYWNENNNLDATDPTSTVDLMVQVFDWQHGATVDPAYPDPANLTGIRESSNVHQLEVIVPALQDAPVTVNTPESGTGSPSDPLTYRIQFTNENSSGLRATGLLAVRDELNGIASPGGRMPIPELPAGFPYDTEDILDYSLYQLIHINNASYDATYQGELDLGYSDQYAMSDHIEISPEFFMDLGGGRFLYQWDYDYDGVTFDVDGEGYPSPRIEFTRAGRHDIGLRVITGSVPPHEYVYTIPVWSAGEVFETPLHSTVVDKRDISSHCRSSAVAMTDDYYYCAFTSEAGVRRDIWLVVGDKDGFFTSRSVTSIQPEECFFPAIIPITDGVNDRLIVLYSRYMMGEWELWSTYGGLDGYGFDVSHARQVAASMKFNAYPDLVQRQSRIFAYYWCTDDPTTEGNIALAYTDDFGESWNNYPTLVDAGSTTKLGVSAEFVSSQFETYVVWEDFRDILTNGSDIYMAHSSDGLSFTTGENISPYTGDVDERYPEAASHDYTLAIAYLADPNMTNNNEVHVLIKNTYYGSQLDYRIVDATIGMNCQNPSIDMASESRMTVAFSKHKTSTDELTSVAIELEQEDGFMDFRENTLYHEPAGTISSVNLTSYPGSGVACRSLVDEKGVESFMVWTVYTNGSHQAINPFTLFLGDIDSYSYVSSVQ